MGLCTVAQVRAAGLGSPGWDETTYPDSLIQCLIDSASQLIEEKTGNRFSATTLSIWLEGSGQQMVGPIRPVLDTITGATITIDDTDYTAGQVSADVEIVELEGRKCKQFLRLINTTAVLPGTWPLPYSHGTPNIKLTGSFGWLDNSGSPTGQTPQAIQQLCIDLVADGLTNGYLGSLSSDTSATGPLQKEKVDVWEKSYFQAAASTIARAINDDWAAMVWSAYTCPRQMVRAVPFGRG